MTRQEIFNKVARHLLTQGRAAMVDSVACRYRMELEDGCVLKCAVGCLIPDEDYSESMEGRTLWGNNPVRTILRRIGVQDPDIHMLCDLQACHDNYGASTWRDRMRDIAIRHCLDETVLDSI